MSAVTATALALGLAAGGAILALVLDAFGSRPAAISLAALGLAGGAGTFGYSAVALQTTAIWGVLRVGGGYAAISAVIAALACLALLGGWASLVEREWGGTIAALIAFGAAASIVVANAKDLVTLLIALEIAAAAGYALVAAGGRRTSHEAALKYFIQGAVATAFFILGMAVLVTVFLPTGDLDRIGMAMPSPYSVKAALAGVVLLLAALAFKSGSAPFHAWAPDAYEAAEPASSAFLSSGPKIGAMCALAILGSLAASGVLELPVAGVLTVLGVLSVLVGSVTALRQRAYTRMLGYAGVAQVGYAIIAVAIMHQPLFAIFFIASYAVASTGTFLAAEAFRRIRPQWDGSIDGLAGMSADAPILALATSVLLISLAGIPPLLGFWAKFSVFVAAFIAVVVSFSQGGGIAAWLALMGTAAGVIGSIVSLAYYGGVLRALYAPVASEPDPSGDADRHDEPARRGSASAQSVVVALALAVIGLGLVPLVIGLNPLTGLFK